ncbi:MAG: response regulator [Gammaproteobacteria bacterium]|jgi:two-component system response regulator RegA|nr:response regulator [Gammaproteobacteria bacterium]
MKILLVDDDQQFSAIMARGFERRGFETRCAASADEAITQCADFQPTHILLDLNMPGKSGLVVLPQLLASAPAAKLVVLTGYSSIATAVAATQAGATHYLCKPAGMDDVIKAFDGPAEAQPPAIPADPISVERLEWEHIQKVLRDNDNNVSATARALGMHRRTLQRKLQKRPVQH